MGLLQDCFAWIDKLSDEDAVFAILGAGMLLDRKHRAKRSEFVGPEVLLDEYRTQARSGELYVNFIETWHLLDRLHPFLIAAEDLASFARQVIDRKPTWIRMTDPSYRFIDEDVEIQTRIRFVSSVELYESMLAPMRPRETPNDPDLSQIYFWSPPYWRGLSPSIRPDFKWPLRVRGFNTSSRILSELRELDKEWVLPLISVESERRGPCDVLFVDETVLEKAPEELREASVVVVLLSPGIKLSPRAWRRIASIEDDVNPRPSAFVVVHSNEKVRWPQSSFLTRWLIELVRSLSHDRPLLASTFAASLSPDSASQPFVIASFNPSVYDPRLSEVASRQLHDYQLTPDRWIDLSARIASRFCLSPGLQPIEKLASQLGELTNFVQESYDATVLSNLFHDLSHNTFSAKEIDVNRWLQTQVLRDGQNVEKVFQTDQRLVVRVWIGPEDPGSIRADVRFPSDRIDWSDEVERLTVVFTEPTYVRDPQIQTIDLPQLGHSTTCDFTLDTRLPEGRESLPLGIRARIAILHRNRVLQTAILAGELVKEQGLNDEQTIRLEIEGVVRPDLNDLRNRQRFDAAIIVNETPEHEHTMVTVSALPQGDTKATFRPLTDILKTMKDLSKELTTVASMEEPPPWESAEFERLFLILAQHGHDIYRQLVEKQPKEIAERIRDANYLQVVAADEQVYFPIELFYRRQPPVSTARICPDARQALIDNNCPADCPGSENTDDYVCPMGFFGMQKVIERHTCRQEAAVGLSPGDFRVQIEPSSNQGLLHVFEKIVYGASRRVWEYTPAIMPPLEEMMKSLSSKETVSVENWNDLKTKSAGVSLLVLIPHCEMNVDKKYESLEIGTIYGDSTLLLSDLRSAHLGLAAGQKRAVIVLLMGCKTGSPDADYKGYAAKFRQQGAAVVITSLSKVLGRQVVPVTQALLKSFGEELAQRSPIRLGELLTSQRRKLLAEGYALAIGITAYGDAEWMLGSTQPQVVEVAHAVR